MKRNFWENLIIIAIILVIVQTFLDEYSRYAHWSILSRNILLFAGLFFDIIFSMEFILRSIFAGKRKRMIRYWIYERGWVDFLSSLPLLLLNSGPSVYLLLSGHLQEEVSAIGIVNVLKVVKAIRITRILRLVRIIKIFGKIQNAESPMAQHHVSAISTTAVFTIIITLMAFTIITSPMDKNLSEREAYYEKAINSVIYFNKNSKLSKDDVIKTVFAKDNNLLKLASEEKVLISNINESEFNKYYNHEDYSYLKVKGFTAYYSITDINREHAFWSMQNFFIIIFIVLAFMLVYTRHFAQTISDLIHVMNKGFRKKDYNLLVKIREEYSQDEIYKLAKFYNDAYLPAKIKKIAEQDDNKTSKISINFLDGFKS